MAVVEGPLLTLRHTVVEDEAVAPPITYSPKVFIPLTHLCRDACGYCTFAESPRRARAPYLELDEVRAIARQGAQAGCHEALFTLGEAPEERYPEARDWLDERGYTSTVDYLVAACAAVLADSGLLPHANAGAVSREELLRLRSVSPSQGMMIESLNPDLPAHRGAPDKSPERRLATLEWAGELAIPFTTGILVGFGESRSDRVDALEAIAASHRRHGHVQEVIVQNFIPKPGTAMRNAPACSTADLVDAITLARTILPADIAVQAPPNLVDDPGVLIAAGVTDFGGISPVTADFVNPERPWPQIEHLRAITHQHDRELVPRLTVHPAFVRSMDRWIAADMHTAVRDRADAEGYARDDPGSVFREEYRQSVNVGTGAEVVLSGRRSTAWYAGSDVSAPMTLDGAIAYGPVAEVLRGVELGHEVGIDEMVTLFGARGREVSAVAAAADRIRADVVGDVVTYVVNRNINYTNVCTFKCTFCGFSKGPLSLNLRGTPYLLTDEEIAARVREAAERGATEVCLQGGIHPDFDGEFYLRVVRIARAAAPDIHVHAFTALEVSEGARRLGIDVRDYLVTLRDAGLASLPGTAAEILDDEVRAIICPDKVGTQEWLDVHEAAHEIGLTSNITIMFGSIDEPIHWARHIERTRAVQRRTGGFTEFIPLPFVHMAAPMYLKGRARRGPTWREVVLMHAVGRIAYRGCIENIQASWVKLGVDGARQLLSAGVNDLGGTLMDENISRAAGASHGQGLERADFEAIVAPLGRTLQQRTTRYAPLMEIAV
jgi:FO synthase